MIEINLLPEDLKVKVVAKKSTAVNPLIILYAVGGVIGILVLIHVIVFLISFSQSAQLSGLQKKWKELEPQRAVVDEFKKAFASASQDAVALQQLVSQQAPWAKKLNKLSIDLPSGIWFKSLDFSGKEFTLEGTAVSLENDEISVIRTFIETLKNDKDFFKDFKTLELKSVQKGVLQGYDVSDFVLVGVLK